MKYDFGYEPGSSYAHLVALLDQHAARGLVIDLGCGAGQIADPLRALGFEYAGCDVDTEALATLAERGIEAHPVDLAQLDQLPHTVRSLSAGRPVAAITMLDVLEHLPDPHRALNALGAALRAVDAELLGLSVPNVAHADLAAQLLMGRWEVTDTGLLDRTHLSLFTDRRLTRALDDCGFGTVDRNDVVLPVSDQHEPADAPALDPNTPLGSALRTWRSSADEFGDTYQFIGLYRLGAAAASIDRGVEGVDRPFATVVVRTLGSRTTLEESLTSLAAQTFDDFEVLVVVNTSDPEAVARVDETLSAFAVGFRARVERVVCDTPTRSAPLNLALDRARGRYLTFLDDDDVVLAHWMETFTRGLEFPGHIVRSVCYGQDFANEPDISSQHFEPVAAPVSFPRSFDYIDHLVESGTPFCSVALPLDALRVHRIRFDESLDVSEDYDVLIRASQLCGVLDTGVATSLYRRWQRPIGTTSEITYDMWDRTHKAVLAKLDAQPLLLPRHSATRVRMLEHDYHRVDQRMEQLRGRVDELEREAAGLRHQVDAYERSRFWKLTKPLRVATRGLHGVRSRRRGDGLA
ncbi:MAG TPA: methyltransferase domain-containing protein [Ilumatobacter sp.]|nr:methyltransferase domain-containing protein [Ilumatobacter sp.]